MCGAQISLRDNRLVLRTAERPLIESHDLIVLDLDGVVYVGPQAVPHAAESLGRAVAAGRHLAYVTNNASRTPEQVADKLVSVGMPATPSDVVTSAQAAAHLMSDRLSPGSLVYVIGGEGLEQALADRGLVPTRDAERRGDIAGVAQGYGPDLAWRKVIDGAILVREGLPWVASNTDLTIPTPHGPGPGNGTLVKLVAEYAGRVPEVAGKPATPLFEETLARVGGSSPIMIGDRVDTDIEGANAIGWPSLLVLTGVSDIAELVAAQPHQRPSYLGLDLRDLFASHRTPVAGSGGWACGGFLAQVVGDRLLVEGEGEALDWYRAAVAAAWAHLDAVGTVVDVSAARPPR